MKKISFLVILTMIFALSLPVSAVTVAYWDMADPGAADQAQMPGNASREADADGSGTIDAGDFLISSTDLSGNGNHLSAWTSSWMKWTATSAMGDFAMEATNNWPDSRTDSTWSSPEGIDVEAISPLQWTVECVFQATAEVNRTMVGRCGQSLPGSSEARRAAFYLAERDGQAIGCQFVDSAGITHNALSGSSAIVAGTWYHVAAVSDGQTLSVYLKDLDADTAYQVVATDDLSGSSDPSIAKDEYDASDFAHEGSAWTVGCATWDGGTVDRFVSPGKIDLVAISDTPLAPGSFAYETGPTGLAAYDPNPLPLNTDGTVGTLNGSNEAELTLEFKAAKDPNGVTAYPVNPEVLRHYVFLSISGSDPNLQYVGYVDQVHDADPNLTDPVNTYPASGVLTLDQGATYYWQVEEGVNDGTGNPCAMGDPNNVVSGKWSFDTVAAIPRILTDPRPAVADESGNAAFTVTATATATTFEWYKDGETLPLTDGGIYSDTDQATLVITGAGISDEAAFHCIAYNGDTPSDPSASAWLVTPRLIGYWPLDGDMLDYADNVEGSSLAHDGAMSTTDPNYPNFVVEPDPDGGFAGKGMRFQNEGEFVQIPEDGFFNTYCDGFTINYWIKHNVGASTDWLLHICKFDIGEQGWLFGSSGENPDPEFIIEQGGLTLSDFGALEDGKWHMITVTYDADTDEIIAFADGDQVDQGTVDLSKLPLPVRPIQIGGEDAGEDTTSIDAAMSEVKIYSYPRTPTQIAAEYTDNVDGAFVCVETTSGLANGDLNGDCKVDLNDFAYIAADYLMCYRVPVSQCDAE